MRLLFWDYNRDSMTELKDIFRTTSESHVEKEPSDERHTTLNSIEGIIRSQNRSTSSHGFNFDYLLVDGSKLSQEMQYTDYIHSLANLVKNLNSSHNNTHIGVIFYYQENDLPVFFEGEGTRKKPHPKLNENYRTFHVSKDRLKESFTRDYKHLERALVQAEKDFLSQHELVPSKK